MLSTPKLSYLYRVFTGTLKMCAPLRNKNYQIKNKLDFNNFFAELTLKIVKIMTRKQSIRFLKIFKTEFKIGKLGKYTGCSILEMDRNLYI